MIQQLYTLQNVHHDKGIKILLTIVYMPYFHPSDLFISLKKKIRKYGEKTGVCQRASGEKMGKNQCLNFQPYKLEFPTVFFPKAAMTN